MATFRETLVNLALDWHCPPGLTPGASYSVARYDAALLAGLPEPACRAAALGAGFSREGLRYEVIASRDPDPARLPRLRPPSGDRLIWLAYDRHYALLEAWECDAAGLPRPLTADALRAGRNLLTGPDFTGGAPAADCIGHPSNA